ncbi:MAG: hypothetical protein II813_03870, partial [Spirochaetales bacterium]|nr:hypothetical protein [Spirochaetales bacterium]
LPGEQSVLLPFHIIKTKVKGSGCYPESLAVECFQKEGLPHFYFATVPTESARQNSIHEVK